MRAPGASAAAAIDAATPPQRDRYLDALRVAAIAMVILGHWMVRVVTAPDSAPEAGYLLLLAPHWQWATLLWQVMPVFFFVGGRVNAESWRRARADGQAPALWMRRRARRLLFPVLALLTVLLPAAALVHAVAGVDALIFDFGVAVFPLWFLAAYLAVTALTPLTLALHEQGHGTLLLGGSVALALAVDLLRFTLEGPYLGTQPAVGGINFVLVWVAIHQIGYLWADDRLPARPARQALMALAGVAALALMIGSGLYPLTMVPIEGTTRPNNGSPPSGALIALGLVQLGCALLCRGPVTRLLRRPMIWAPVALAGGQIITLFLWHQAAMLAVANTAYPAGLMPLTETVDARWWATRPIWLGLCAVVLAAVAYVMRRFDAPPPGTPPGGPWRSGLGVVLFGGGVAGLIATRLFQESMPLSLPWPAILAVTAGMAALGVFGRRPAARD